MELVNWGFNWKLVGYAEVKDMWKKIKKVADDAIVYTDLGDCDFPDDEVDDWDVQFEGAEK